MLEFAYSTHVIGFIMNYSQAKVMIDKWCAAAMYL